MAAGVNVMDLRRGINIAVDAVISHLRKRAWMISTSEEITQVNSFLKIDSLLSYRLFYILINDSSYTNE